MFSARRVVSANNSDMGKTLVQVSNCVHNLPAWAAAMADLPSIFHTARNLPQRVTWPPDLHEPASILVRKLFRTKM
jgi:hypothetical protein